MGQDLPSSKVRALCPKSCRLPLTLSDIKIHTSCCVIMQDLHSSRKLWHRPGLRCHLSTTNLPPGVDRNVSIVSGGESYRVACTHCCTQSDIPPPIMNMDISHIFPENGSDLFLLPPPGGFSDDLSVYRPSSVYHKIVSLLLHFPLSLFLFFTICSYDGHQSQSWK